jgi:dTDP-4-amino-4,6-dideoxygalactose transaminase
MIPFNVPPHTGNEAVHVLAAMTSEKLSGDGRFGIMCQEWFENYLGCSKALLTPSCTQALEMAAILIDIQPGDEVIMPSYTFVSTANSFVVRGARIVFVDIRPDTMNLDEALIEDAITPRTKAIVVVHYAGVACEMEIINTIAARHGVYVIEDAAQGMMATYRNRPLGTLGHMASYSLHETKNITSGGEGGVLILNDERFVQRAEIIREKGTNRTQFFRGMIDKYTWVDVGSSYLPSELQAAYLWGQLAMADAITSDRLATWRTYQDAFADLQASGQLDMPYIPPHCQHNGHMFYLKCKDLDERTALLAHLKKNDVMAVFHYVPLHSAPAGKIYGRFHGTDCHTTSESERLMRLPLWYGMEEHLRNRVVDAVRAFFQ